MLIIVPAELHSRMDFRLTEILPTSSSLCHCLLAYSTVSKSVSWFILVLTGVCIQEIARKDTKENSQNQGFAKYWTLTSKSVRLLLFFAYLDQSKIFSLVPIASPKIKQAIGSQNYRRRKSAYISFAGKLNNGTLHL